jgi:hypothetical protein
LDNFISELEKVSNEQNEGEAVSLPFSFLIFYMCIESIIIDSIFIINLKSNDILIMQSFSNQQFSI